MKVDDFDFVLPRENIAARPASPRDSARLLHVRADGLDDAHVRDLPSFLRPGDRLVINDTKVIPARLKGRRGEAGIEATLHRRLGSDLWQAFARPAKKLKPGDTILFAEGFSASVVEKGEAGEVTLRFDRAGQDLMAALEAFGEMPLPPYIKREHGADEQDKRDYQTLFARQEGAVAAPTAGLHFTDSLLDSLARNGVGLTRVTLHVGAGTFLPVKSDDTSGHKMHFEEGCVTADAADAINRTRREGGRIVAVGTTSTRLLESAAAPDGVVKPFQGATDLFILPGYQFRAVDRLMTNFHLPRSTLFMLVSAFAGQDRMKAAYAHAIASGYRFYSYGDACLLEPVSEPI